MPKKKLDGEQQRQVVIWLARCLTPAKVAELVKEHFRVTLTRQAVEWYDPMKALSKDLAPELRDLFLAERKAYVEDLDSIPIRHKAVRLQRLEELFEVDRDRGNTLAAARHIEQAKQEVEDLGAEGGEGTDAERAEYLRLLRKVRFDDSRSDRGGGGTPQGASPETGSVGRRRRA